MKPPLPPSSFSSQRIDEIISDFFAVSQQGYNQNNILKTNQDSYFAY
jgi:hypothetical protein